MQAKGLEAVAFLYSAASSARERGKQLHWSLGLLEQRLATGLETDEITYSAAISACEKARGGIAWGIAL